MSGIPTVGWPSFCDLCESHTTTPERCSHCGHRLRPIERPEVPPRPGQGLEPAPLAQATTELRRSHRATLAELAGWTLAQGRTVDLDVAAICLEPLQCYGGLGANGHPRPDGVDVDFFCQCYLPHDPACPPDMAQISVGRNWSDRDDLFEYVALGHGVPRSTDVPMSAFEPLAKLCRRARAQPSMFPFLLDLFDHIGTLPPDGKVPELWVYRFTGSNRKGWPPLALDEHGGAWRPVRHRGRRRGFHWKPMDDRSAAHHCGVASWDFDRAHRQLERRDPWEDWDDDLDPDLPSVQRPVGTRDGP